MVVDWTALSAIATAFGALASFSAVATALWLARNANRPHLKIEAVLGFVTETYDHLDYVIVEIANTGVRSEIITSIWFKPNGTEHRLLFKLHNSSRECPPTKIEPGESKKFFYEPTQFLNDIEKSLKFTTISLPLSVEIKRKMFVGAQTATNFEIRSRVSPVVQELFDTSNPAVLVSNEIDGNHPMAEAMREGARAIYTTRHRYRRSDRSV